MFGELRPMGLVHNRATPGLVVEFTFLWNLLHSISDFTLFSLTSCSQFFKTVICPPVLVDQANHRRRY